MAQTARYKGDGSEYLSGVPARNLDEDDFHNLTDEQKAAVQRSPLYDLRGAGAEREARAAERRVDKAVEAQAATAPAEAPAAPKAKGGEG